MRERDLLRRLQRTQEGDPIALAGHTVDAESQKPSSGVQPHLPGVSSSRRWTEPSPTSGCLSCLCPTSSIFWGKDSLWPQECREEPKPLRVVLLLVLKVTTVATVNSVPVDRITVALETGRLRTHLEKPIWTF